MGPLIFEIVPRELRDHIWKYVLTSPTGFVTLPQSNNLPHPCPRRTGVPLNIVPYNPENCQYLWSRQISLSVLRTCKQVYAECKDLLWKCNALRIERAYDLPFILQWSSLATGLRKYLREIEMDILDTLDHDRLSKDAIAAAQQVATWAGSGALKRLTLTFEDTMAGISGPVYRMGVLMSTRPAGADILSLHDATDCRILEGCTTYIALLCERSENSGRRKSPQLQKKMVLNTGFLGKDRQSKIDWLQGDSGPCEVAKTLHVSFGGELWMDSILCYKDGRQLGNLFD